MNRRKRFLYNGIMLTAVGIAIRSVSIAFSSYISKSVGAEGIGLFTLIMNVYAFAVTFATSGISLTVTRLVADAIGDGRSGECRKIMRNAILYCLIFSGAAFLVLFFFANRFSVYILGDTRSAEPLRILAFSLIPLSLSSAVCGYFVGVKRVFKNAVVQVLCQAFKIFITVYLILKLSDKGALYAVVGLSLSITLTELFCFLVVFVEYALDRIHTSKSTKKAISKFSDVTSMALPLAFSAYIRSALLTIEHSLIPKGLTKRGESTSEALSSYGILHGMALPMLIYPMALLSSFAGLLVPEFAESAAMGEEKRMRRLAGEALEATLAYSVAVGVLLYVFSEEIGYVVYDSYYAGHYIAVMSCVIPIMYLDHVADSMLKGIGEHVYSMWINIADALISVFLVWILIPIMGIGGYAVVIILMEGFNFIFSISRLYKKLPFKVNLFKALLLPLISAACAGFASRALFIQAGSTADIGWLIMKITFAACIFFVIYSVGKIKFGNGKKAPSTNKIKNDF
ncbi:MAG: oligosaccharide flippase family protein [Clostridia bacterium]|nr:oligosaccharide flippase family protein [Clostridia bacterium]